MTRQSAELDQHEQDLAPAQQQENAITPSQELTLAKLMTLGPRDHDGLAAMLMRHPELQDAMLAYATSNFGNDMVARALAIVSGVANPAPREEAFMDAQIAAQTVAADEPFMAEQIANQDKVLAEEGFMAEEIAEQDQVQAEEQWMAGKIAEQDQVQADEQFMGRIIEEQAALQDEQQVEQKVEVLEQQTSDTQVIDQQIEAKTHQDNAGFVEQVADQQADAAQEQATVAEPPAAEVLEPAPLDAEQQQVVEVVEQLDSNDTEILAATLAQEPEVAPQVIEAATEQVGEEVVEEAIAVQAEQQEEVVEVKEEEPAAEVAPSQAEVQQAIEEPSQEVKDEAWAQRADAYNERHAALVEEFHQLTGDAFRLPDGSIDELRVLAFQQENGLQADGKVGPLTLAAARAGAKAPSAAGPVTQAAEQAEEIVDEPPPRGE